MAGAPKLSDLRKSEIDWIAKQLHVGRKLVDTLSPKDAGAPLSAAVLDRAYKTWLARAEEERHIVNGGINAFGVCFGLCLVDRAGFEWVVAHYPEGTELAVVAMRGKADILVHPQNLIAKRWDTREVDFMVFLEAEIRQSKDSVEQEWKNSPKRPWWKFF